MKPPPDFVPPVAVSTPVDAKMLAHGILLRLQGGNFSGAQRIFGRLLRSPLALEQVLGSLVARATAAEQLEPLWQILLHLRGPALDRLYPLGKAVEVGMQLGARNDVMRLIMRASNRRALYPLRFSGDHQLDVFQTKDKIIAKRLSQLKYHDIELHKDSDMVGAAKTLAARVDVEEAFLDQTFAYRKDRSLSRVEWENGVKRGFAFAHMVNDHPYMTNGVRTDYNKLMDPGAPEQLFQSVDLSKGALLATYHGSLAHLSRRMFIKAFGEKGVVFGAFQISASKSIGINQDSRAALMLALRAMRPGTALLTAHDGRQGNRTRIAKVAGVDVPTAGGPALIAYETGCFSAWYNVVLEGDKFVPVIVPAPKPDKGESFESFTERWLAFYWSQVEATLTGDPEKIHLKRRWATLGTWKR